MKPVFSLTVLVQPRVKRAAKVLKETLLSVFCTAAISSTAVANSLDAQLMNIQQIEQQGQQNIKQQNVEKARIAKIQAEKEHKIRAEKQARLEQQRLLVAQQKAQQLQAIEHEKLADKYRDQTYQDQLRKLEVQRQQIALEKELTRAKRENDFIDAELKQQNAKTDVIQSNADVNRKLANGEKMLLQDTGKAKVNQSKGWFG